mgnify:CR=1 FL=1
MLSVIVPTMWKHEPFLDYLEGVLEQESVGEVIIINNDVAATPDSEVLFHEKIRMHNCEKNIYVAPAWNLGAEMAHYDKLCFLSDDTEVDLNVFDKTDAFLTPEIGMVGLLVDDINDNSYEDFFTDGAIEFVPMSGANDGSKPPVVGIGCLFFVNRSDYTPIPKVKIFHGEVMLWKRISTAKENYMIVNCEAYTPWHVTITELSKNSETETAYAQIQKDDYEAAFGFNKVRF